MKKDFDLRMEHVGYKGSSPMHNDLLSGTIKLAIDTLPQNVPFIKDGKLRALAVTSPTRAPLAPHDPVPQTVRSKKDAERRPRAPPPPPRAPRAPDVPSVQELGQKKLVAENF